MPASPDIKRRALAREERAWELRIQGHTRREIVERFQSEGLGTVTRPAVTHMLKRAAARILARMGETVGEEIARQLSALWHIYDEAMKAWERSKEDDRMLRERTKQGAAPILPGGRRGIAPDPEKETVQQLRPQVGDPRYLAEARAALADLRKLLQLEGPQRLQVGGLPGAPPVQVEHSGAVEHRLDVSKLSDAELDQLDRTLAKLTEPSGN
jgi:hypothetical protein